MRLATRTAFGVVVLFLAASCQQSRRDSQESPVSAETSPDIPSEPSAVVTESEATITIPVGRRPVWRWNVEATPANQREYQWEVSVASRAVGFSLFKYPGAPVREGSLSELLQAGQSSIWKGTQDGGGTWEGPVRVMPADHESAVEIVVQEPSILAGVRATRPTVLTVVTRTPEGGQNRYSVPVTYQGI